MKNDNVYRTRLSALGGNELLMKDFEKKLTQQLNDSKDEWNVSDFQTENPEVEDLGPNEIFVAYSFNAIWPEPQVWIKRVSQDFPDLSFTLFASKPSKENPERSYGFLRMCKNGRLFFPGTDGKEHEVEANPAKEGKEHEQMD